MCEKFSTTRTCPSQAKNIPTCQKSALLPVSSINSEHINIYTRIYTKRTKVFVHIPTVSHGRNMHDT